MNRNRFAVGAGRETAGCMLLHTDPPPISQPSLCTHCRLRNVNRNPFRNLSLADRNPFRNLLPAIPLPKPCRHTQ